jgi:hypothetical protein
MFTSLWNATGAPIFADAARRWYAHLLSQRVPGSGVSGFPSWKADGWKSDASFLTGASGIALALLAAVTDIEPQWDRALAMSLP